MANRTGIARGVKRRPVRAAFVQVSGPFGVIAVEGL